MNFRSRRRLWSLGAPLATLAASCAGPGRDMKDVMIAMEHEYRSLEALLGEKQRGDAVDFPAATQRATALSAEIDALQTLDAPDTVDAREFERLGLDLRAPHRDLSGALARHDLAEARAAIGNLGERCERCHDVAGWE